MHGGPYLHALMVKAGPMPCCVEPITCMEFVYRQQWPIQLILQHVFPFIWTHPLIYSDSGPVDFSGY